MADTTVSTAVPDEFAQPARWRAFRDPSVEAAYRQWHFHQVNSLARAVGIATVLLSGSLPVAFRLLFGEWIPAVVIANWVIGVPVVLASLVVSFAGRWRWATRMAACAMVVVGLDAAWTNGTLYGFDSPTIALGVFAVAVFAPVIRLRTLEAAFAVSLMLAIPVGLLIDQTRTGAISLFHSWPSMLILVASTLVLIVASAIIDAGMRQQFAAQRTIVRQQRQLEVSQRLLRKFAPAAVAERIESGDANAVGQPQRLRVTALSSDVAGFTALADQIDPESLSQIINEYMAAMSDVVESKQGVVTEFAGDGLMAIFGAPEQQEPAEQVRHALGTANAMHARLGELNETWFRLGIEQPLRVRVGINTGMLSVGTFGSDGRATYTAIGLQMNVAARIQAQCEPGGTLLSSASWHLVKDDVDCDELGEVTVKGVHFPISIYAPRSGSVGGTP